MIVIVLAAGKGSRMHSSLPKPLLSVAGKPMLSHVLAASKEVESDPLLYRVVYGFGKEAMRLYLSKSNIGSVYQQEQLGTGHAVKEALRTVATRPCSANENTNTMVLYGDVPLIKASTLLAFQDAHISSGRDLTIMSTTLDDPSGHGRVIESAHGEVMGIVEEKDASTEDKKINVVNTGIMMANTHSLKRWCGLLTNNNAQSEYYLTDVVALAVGEQAKVGMFCVDDSIEVSGANTPGELNVLEEAFLARRKD
jgi:bifunctional UDP-N-acetylglucosamine pyrophosphorylase/glucosamine-1-phosphate N-acetyltransferase